MIRILTIILALTATNTLMSITLDESIDLALEHNLSLRSAAQDIEISKEFYREVTSSLLPQISFNGGYQLSRTEIPGSLVPPAFNIIDQLSEDATADDQLLAAFVEQGFNMFIPDEVQDETNIIGQIKLDQIVYLGGKLMSGIRAARIYRTIESERYELLRQELIYQTTNLFYQGLLLKDVIEINREGLELARAHYDRINSMFDQGLVSEFDLIRAELEVLKLRPQLQEAENNHSIWQENFRKHIGLELDEEINLQGEISLPEVTEVDLTEALETGKKERIELYLSQAFRDLYEIQWRAERGNYLPNVGLSAEYNRFSSVNRFQLEPENFGTSYQVMLGIQIPVFTGFGNRAKIAQARHEYKKATLESRDLEDKIELDIRNAYLRLSNAIKQYEAQAFRIDLAERGLNIATARYENQVGLNLEVLDAQLEYKVSRLSYLQAVYEIIMAEKGLQKAMGIEL